jgi:SAM-dependent methyltransferase
MTMTTSTGFYSTGATLTERERLLAQAASQAPEARWLLDQLGVQPGWRVVDMGCGPIGMLDLLAERVGVDGRVLGIEREPRFVDMGRSLIAERQLVPAEIMQADATATSLPDHAFDLVHARLVLLHQREPNRLLTEMIRLARVGGWLALQEIDAMSFVCEPPHPAWTRLWEDVVSVSTDLGIDVYLGRRLPGILRTAGLEDVHAEVHTRLTRPGDYGRTHLLSLVTAFRDSMLQRGLLTEPELADHMAAVDEHVRNPATVVVREMIVQAWGRKGRADRLLSGI